MRIRHHDSVEVLNFANAGEKVEWMYRRGLITESEKVEAMSIIELNEAYTINIKNEENESNA